MQVLNAGASGVNTDTPEPDWNGALLFAISWRPFPGSDTDPSHIKPEDLPREPPIHFGEVLEWIVSEDSTHLQAPYHITHWRTTGEKRNTSGAEVKDDMAHWIEMFWVLLRRDIIMGMQTACNEKAARRILQIQRAALKYRTPGGKHGTYLGTGCTRLDYYTAVARDFTSGLLNHTFRSHHFKIRLTEEQFSRLNDHKCEYGHEEYASRASPDIRPTVGGKRCAAKQKDFGIPFTIDHVYPASSMSQSSNTQKRLPHPCWFYQTSNNG